MKPPDFHYLAPRSLEEAMSGLAEHGEDAQVLAGGQSLVPMMNLRLAAPSALVDLNYLGELSGVERTDDHLVVGSMTRHHDVAMNALLREHVPVLAHAASLIGYPAIRNRGTIGGSLCHADPVAEMPCVALMLDAELQVAGPAGQRTIPAAEFFDGYFSTALAPAEILTAVKFHNGFDRWSFKEFARKTGDFAVAAAAATASIKDSTIQRLRVGLAGVSDRPVRANQLEQTFSGMAVPDARKAVADGQGRSTIAAEGESAGWNADRAEVAAVLADRAIVELLDSPAGA